MKNVSLSKAWAMWSAVALFYAYQYILRVLPNIIMPDLMANFQINSSEFGQFAGIYYIGYAVAHIPIGIWLDRKNPKLVIPICILITISGLFPIILSKNIIFANIGRLVMGIGSSGAILGAFKVIRLGFPETSFNRMLGLCVAFGVLGALYGGMPISHLLHSYSWQQVIKFIIMLGIAITCLTYFVIPSYENKKSKSFNILKDIKKVFGNINIIIVCICAGLMVGPLEGFADVWGAGFLQTVYNIEKANAAGLTSLIFLGMCLGAPGLSYIADKLRKHTIVIIFSGFLMCILFLLMILNLVSKELLSTLCFAIGIFSAYQIIAIYIACTFVKEELVGITTAVTNMIIMTFGYFFHTVIGIAIGNPEHNNSFSPEQYAKGLYVIPICLMIACIGFIFINSKKIKKNK